MSEAFLTCRELIAFIADYEEGSLPEADRIRFESHLRACAACVDYLASYREAAVLAGRALEGPVPDDVPEDLVRSILSLRRR